MLIIELEHIGQMEHAGEGDKCQWKIRGKWSPVMVKPFSMTY